MPDVSMFAEVVGRDDEVLSFGRLETESLSLDPKPQQQTIPLGAIQQQTIPLGDIQQQTIRLAPADEIDALVSLRIHFKNMVVFAFEFL